MSKLPNPEPVQKALALLIEKHRVLAGIPGEQRELVAKVDELIRSGDPSNEGELVKISTMRTRLDMLPHVAKRLEGELDGLRLELGQRLGSFEKGIIEAAATERAALVEKLEKMLAPYAPPIRAANGETVNRAEQIAEALPMVRSIPASDGDLPAPPAYELQDTIRDSNALARRAEKVLEYHEEVRRVGSFVPQEFGK